MRPPWTARTAAPPAGSQRHTRPGSGAARASATIHPDRQSSEEPWQLLQPVYVVRSVGAEGNARPQDLHGRHAEVISRPDFCIRIVAHHQHLVRHELVSLLDFLKQALLAFAPRLVDHVDADRRELRAQAE